MEIHWLAYPFKVHSGSVGSFSAVALQHLCQPIPLATVEPNSTELAILSRRYPDADPAEPPWREIEADLIVAGITRSEIKGMTSRQLMLVLDRVGEKESGQADSKADSTKKTHPTSERVSKAILAINRHRTKVQKGKAPYLSIKAILSEYLGVPVENKEVATLARQVRNYNRMLVDKRAGEAD
jgi:hypothetical protein